MFFEIFKKELREGLLDAKFILSTVFCTLIISLSFFTMIKDYQFRLNNFHQDKIRAETWMRLAKENGWLPPMAWMVEYTDVLLEEPNPLSIFAQGADRTISTEGGKSSGELSLSRAHSLAQVNPIFAYFPTPDFTFVTIFILSIFGIFYSFDAVCGEKQQGTLRMILANNVPRSKLILGKMTGRFILLMASMLIAALLGFSQLLLSPILSLKLSHYLGITGVLINSILYVAIFFFIGFLFSCIVHKSSLSLLLSLIAWFLFVLVLPSQGKLAAERISSLPLPEEIESLKFLKKSEVMAGASEWRESYPRWAKVGEIFITIDQNYRNNFLNQQLLIKKLTFISPASLLYYINTNISGTSVGDEQNYLSRVNAFLNELRIYGAKKFEREIGGEKKSAQDSLKAPLFMYRSRGLKERLENSLLESTGLVFFSFLFGLLSYIRFLKYDVR